MINIKAILLALLICIAIPVKSVAEIDTANKINEEKYWWAMLYPQLCGNGDALEKEDTEVTLKILELFS